MDNLLVCRLFDWEIIPGYNLGSADWWTDWFVVLAAVLVLAIVLVGIVFFLGYFRMSKEERAALGEKRAALKALKGKERKEFIKAQSPGTRVVLRWKSARFVFYPIFGVVLVISLVATPVLYTFGPALYSTLFYKDNVSVTEASRLAAQEATANVVTIEEEGIVLLDNRAGVLPLDTNTNKKINVFGTNAFGMFYGNGGSGEFATDYTYNKGKANERTVKCTKFEEALAAEGFEYNPYLLNLCKNYAANKSHSIAESDFNLHASIATFGTSGRYEGIKNRWIPYEHEPDAAAYLESYDEISGQSLIDYCKSYSDKALICISRYGTENYDLPFTKKDELRLTAQEYDLLELVTDNFKDVIVLLNTPGPMYLNDLDDFGIKTVVYVGHPGLTGTKAIAEVLSGKVNPSGRTVDTWPYDLTSNPTYETFGLKSTTFTNGANYPFSNYYEGIYVGYRYYTTRALTDDTFNYADYVRYSFGHGLSYTTFNSALHSAVVDEEKGEITFQVDVTNTGEREGKYVIELYDNPPYTKGGIEKSARNLIAYQKTNLIKPKELERYELKVKLRDLASWSTAKGHYVLEKGDYEFILSENCWDAAVDTVSKKDNKFVYTLANDINYTTSYQTGKEYRNLFQDAEFGGNKEKITYLSRADWEGTYTKNADVNRNWNANIEVNNNNLNGIKFEDNKCPDVVTDRVLDNPITLYDMKKATFDDPRWDDFLDQLSQTDMVNLVGDPQGPGFGIPAIKSIGMKNFISEGDGPASCYNSGTGHPSGVILASTWNNDAAELFGKSCAKEGSAMGMTGWYAPGMNIHRSPYAGRNFEYYSEDPLIAGNMGGYTAIGAKQMGIYTFAKHFGLNEQEQKRLGLNVFCSEQGIREIYLKPFEIYTDLGGIGMMSAFSSIGTTWAGASEALLTSLLREEWGFHGSVITDYNNSNMPVANGLRAGNDEWLVSAQTSGMNTALNSTPHDIRYYLRRASKNILYCLANSNAAWTDADFEAADITNPHA